MSIDIVTFRGLIEKNIDFQLERDNLANMHTIFEELRPAIANRESAIFGYIVGFLISSAWQLVHTVAKRTLTQEEIHEVTSIILRRGLEIRSKIMETST